MDYIPIFNRIPSESATLEEWKAWSMELSRYAKRMVESDKKRRKQIAKLKAELTKKNAACVHYKNRIDELESPSHNILSKQTNWLSWRKLFVCFPKKGCSG
jgi:hypothetical protein